MYLQQLQESSPTDLSVVSQLLMACTDFRLLTFGDFAQPSDARGLFTGFPPECPPQDRFVWAIHAQSQFLGLLQVARHYPNPHTAHIGLLLLTPSQRGRHLGCQAVEHLTQKLRAWRDVKSIQLGVIAGNAQAIRFWQHCGFQTIASDCAGAGMAALGNIMERPIKARPACRGGRCESSSQQAHARHLFSVMR